MSRPRLHGGREDQNDRCITIGGTRVGKSVTEDKVKQHIIPSEGANCEEWEELIFVLFYIGGLIILLMMTESFSKYYGLLPMC